MIEMQQKFNFWALFQQLPNGKLSPLVIINVNGTVIGPGVSIGPGTNIGGVDFFKILGREIAAEVLQGVYVIKGYYGTPVVF